MIKLKDSRNALLNLPVTIDAIERIDRAIAEYSNGPAVGPADCTFNINGSAVAVQLDRAIAVTALQAQKQRLVDYLKNLGIDAND